MDRDIPGKHIVKKRDLDLGHLAVKAILSFMFLHWALLKQFLMWSSIHCPDRGPRHTVCAGASRSSELKTCVGIQMNAGIQFPAEHLFTIIHLLWFLMLWFIVFDRSVKVMLMLKRI